MCIRDRIIRGDKTEFVRNADSHSSPKVGQGRDRTACRRSLWGRPPSKTAVRGRGEARDISGRAGWARTRPRHFKGHSDQRGWVRRRTGKLPPAGFPLRCPGGQTGPQRSIEEMPRPPSEPGASSLRGLATDNIGYQTASSGSDEAGTGWLEKHSGGHTPQDHPAAVATVAVAAAAERHNNSINSRQPPALPPGAPTAAAQGLTLF